MATLTRSVMIGAPVEEVFGFVLDIGKFWSQFGEVAVREIDVRPEGVGTSATIYSHVLAIHLEGKVEYTDVVPNERIVAKVSLVGEKPTWTFTFASSDGGTTLTAEAEWHVNVPAVGGSIEKMMVKEHEAELEGWLANVRAALEASD